MAHSNSQHINGISEGNTLAAKSIMKSLVGSIQKSSVTHPSFVKVIATFERVADLLNSRPIFHSKTSVMSVKDIMFPSNMSSSLSEKNDDLVISFAKQNDVDLTDSPAIMSLIASADNTHREFCRLFIQSVTDSLYQRFGSKVTRRKNTFRLEDFVVILLADGAKYGIVIEIVSKQTIMVRLLNKNKRIKAMTRTQSFSVEQVTLLYRKE